MALLGRSDICERRKEAAVQCDLVHGYRTRLVREIEEDAGIWKKRIVPIRLTRRERHTKLPFLAVKSKTHVHQIQSGEVAGDIHQNAGASHRLRNNEIDNEMSRIEDCGWNAENI